MDSVKRIMRVLTSDQLVQLGKLSRDSQIDTLISNLNHDTTEDVGLNLVGNKELLTFRKVRLLKRLNNLVQGSLIQSLLQHI